MFAKGWLEINFEKLWMNRFMWIMSNCRITLVNSKDAYTHMSSCYYCKEKFGTIDSRQWISIVSIWKKTINLVYETISFN